jgi:hypothetical protein
MRPVAERELRPFRDFDGRAFVIAAVAGLGATLAVFFVRPSNQGATSASLTDAGAVFVGALIVTPVVALIAARRGGHVWTAVMATLTVLVIGSAIVMLA